MDKVPTPEEIQEAFPREVDEAADLVLDQIFNIMRKSWTTEVRLNFQHVSRRVEDKLRAELTEKGWDVQVERTAEQRLGFFTLAPTTVVTVKPAAGGDDGDDQ